MNTESREKLLPCVIGTAGHIDHGKTSLVGALTGIDTDRLKEEKKRGLSIDIGFAKISFAGGKEAAIIDVPGHERFVRNMLAGSTGIDTVLFCVAADDGIMPQTIEHFDIVTLLGVKNGVFAVTKADMASEGRLSEVTAAIEELKKGSALKSSAIIPVSVRTGKGVEELKKQLEAAALASLRTVGAANQPFRLPIDRSFPIKGFGAVVTGTVASGSIGAGDEVELFPKKSVLRVRGIESHGKSSEVLHAGVRGAVNLSGLSHNDVSRGDMLVGNPLFRFDTGCKSFDCVLNVLKGVKKPLKNKAMLTLYHYTKEVACLVRFKDDTGGMPGKKSYARVFPKEPLMVLPGDRFILRDPSINSTVGGGSVLIAYFDEKHQPKLSEVRFESIEENDKGAAISALIEKHGGCVDADLAIISTGVAPEALPSGTKDFAFVGSVITKRSKLEKIKEAVLITLKDRHSKNPSQKGFPTDDTFISNVALLSSVSRASATLLVKEGLFDLSIFKSLISREGPLISLSGHKPGASAKDASIRSAVVGKIGNRFETIKKEDILGLPFDKKELDRVLKELITERVITQIVRDSFISTAALNEAEQRLRERLRDGGKIKAAEFRDMLGCGRKLAIEILEHFDKERVTLRTGEERVLR